MRSWNGSRSDPSPAAPVLLYQRLISLSRVCTRVTLRTRSDSDIEQGVYPNVLNSQGHLRISFTGMASSTLPRRTGKVDIAARWFGPGASAQTHPWETSEGRSDSS